MKHDPVALIQDCRPRDSVSIRTRHGTILKGKAVICPMPAESRQHVVLNLGGKHGTPGIATADNIVSVNRKLSVTDGYPLTS